MNEAKRVYYKQFIDNSSDQSNLFRTSKKLLNIQTDKTLPPHSDAYTLANEMGQFFAHKITVIRTKLADQPVVNDAVSDCTATVCSGALAFSESAPLSEDVVKDMVSASKKSCAFDPLSSSILSLCLDELLPVITTMVKLSLESGQFAEVWKNASVHPSVKSRRQPINTNFVPSTTYSLHQN